MSTIAVDQITDGNGGSNAVLYGVASPAGGMNFRNRIINGDMRIDQRNAGAAVTATGSYPVDRFVSGNTTDGAFSAQQDSSAPTGFVNSVKVTTTTADASLTGSQQLNFFQYIEGNNVADLAWGAASAKTVTLSFWVRSSLTGSFGGAIRNSAANRAYVFSYSISATDTWEYKTITISGDTSGTWLTTNGTGIGLFFALGAGPDRSGTAGSWASANYTSFTGATSVIGTLNATWYITGVQLEVGSVATEFERRPYGTELALCRRYYLKQQPLATGAGGDPNRGGLAVGTASTTAEVHFSVFWPVQMRTTPTVTAYDSVGNSGGAHLLGTGDISGVAVDKLNNESMTRLYKSGGFTIGKMYGFFFTADAEL